MTDHLSFKAHCAELAPAITAAFEAVQTKAKIPILGNMLLQVEDGQLQVRATDLDIEVQTSCDLLHSSGAGAVTLSGLALKDLVKNLPETAEVTFSVSANHVKVSAGRSRFQFNTLPSKDFPSIANYITATPAEIDLPSMLSAISRVEYAIQSSDDRKFLAGLNIHSIAGEQKLSFVGCDGHNLSVVRIPSKDEVPVPSVILPIRTMRAVRRLFADKKGAAAFAASDVMASISAGGVTLYTKLVDGKYPEYMRTIPQLKAHLAVAPTDALKKSVARVCMVTEDPEKDTVALTFSQGRLQVAMQSRSGESSLEEIDISYSGPDIRIGFDGGYLQNALSSIPTVDFRLQLFTEKTAVVFKPDMESDELRLLMPRAL